MNPTTGALSECNGATVCNSYELGITLERADNIVIANDVDQSVGTFFGANPDCMSATLGLEQCYDVGP